MRELKMNEKMTLDVDGIFLFNHNRVEKQLDTVKPSLRKMGKSLLTKKTTPQLHSFVQ